MSHVNSCGIVKPRPGPTPDPGDRSEWYPGRPCGGRPISSHSFGRYNERLMLADQVDGVCTDEGVARATLRAIRRLATERPTVYRRTIRNRRLVLTLRVHGLIEKGEHVRFPDPYAAERKVVAVVRRAPYRRIDFQSVRLAELG